MDDNPYSPPSITSPVPEAAKPAIGSSLRLFIIAHCLVTVAAFGFEFYDIKSIMFSGPVFAVLGLMIAVIGYRAGQYSAAYWGGSATAFAILLVSLINIFEWDPQRATKPVTLLSTFFAIPALLFGLWLIFFKKTP